MNGVVWGSFEPSAELTPAKSPRNYSLRIIRGNSDFFETFWKYPEREKLYYKCTIRRYGV